MKVKAIIADGNQLTRLGLNAILQNYEDIEIIGEATQENQLLEMIDNFSPEVVVIDFLSPGFSIDTVPLMKANKTRTRCLAITTEQSGHTIVSALRAGIDSYIKKDCDIQEIVDAVRETGLGSKFFCGQILDTIAKEQIDVEDLDLNQHSCEPVLLSEREMEVITLIAEGNTNMVIADKLFLSAHTITTHRKNIMQKLGVNNTAAIVMYAVKTGLVSPNKFLFSKPV
ncbi:MAG: response regulator transcription factor [Flavobacteriales bacterium]